MKKMMFWVGARTSHTNLRLALRRACEASDRCATASTSIAYSLLMLRLSGNVCKLGNIVRNGGYSVGAKGGEKCSHAHKLTQQHSAL